VDTTAILQDVAHRPYPLPTGPWVMTQIWHELLFAHWPIEPDEIRPLLPPILTLDTYERQAWVGVVPFRMSYVRPRGFPPVPQLSQFPELNVRTYVTVNGIPSVYFFSLDAGNPVAVFLARKVFHLPYFNAMMRCQRISSADETILYRSYRTHPGASPAEFAALYHPIAPVDYAQPGSLAYWFTERYCLYTVANQNQVYRGDIHHERWALQLAELDLASNTMALSHGIRLPDVPPLLHYAQRQEVLIWPIRCVL
jgi:uncharacterized protein YqjF (DUF2071 family)